MNTQETDLLVSMSEVRQLMVTHTPDMMGVGMNGSKDIQRMEQKD
jgi:hypothetical protein